MTGNPPLGPSAHVDSFSRDNLPPAELWPRLLLEGFDYPEYLNAAVELTDRMVEKGFGDHIALIGNGRIRSYKELTDWTNRIAHALVETFGDHIALIGNGRIRSYKELTDWTNRIAHALVETYGVRPGNRVLIRSANNPAMVACWLAATKAGAVVVNTMPMLRAGELAKIIDKAQVSHALCDTRLMDELALAAKDSRHLKTVVGFDGTANHDAELDRAALSQPVRFEAVRTGRDDVAL
ncbi:AMP-binding protein, partial [Paracoccus sp. PXZ]